MDHNETRWRMNSSFSPPLPRRWDCRFLPDGLTRGTNDPAVRSSTSSQSRGSRSGVSSEQYSIHHYSVSDGAVSYYGSPSDNPKAPRWMPAVQRYDLGEFSTPAGGARPEASVLSQISEQQFSGKVPLRSSSLSSRSPHSDSSQCASTSKPVFFPPYNFPGRRSFMSKAVYPLVYRDPVSDGKIYECIGRSTYSPDDTKFQKSLTQLHKMDPRWSDATSNEFGFDGDIIDILDHIGLETPKSTNNNSSAGQQRCAMCERPMWQKSPWSAHRMIRSSDMPVSAVLPCGHVFHAECLEETTPKSQAHDPPCPVCKNVADAEGSICFSKSLQVALRSAAGSSSSSMFPDGHMRRNKSLAMPRKGGSLLKSHFKKRFSFKEKTGKDLFGAKMFGRSAAAESTSPVEVDGRGPSTPQNSVGRLVSIIS